MVDFFNPSITSRLLNSITRNPSGLQNSLSKVASGKRLINASVDPAGLAVSEKLRSDLAALSQAIKNTDASAGLLNVAEAGLSSISDLLIRGRELASQAASGTLGNTERQAINQEFQQIVAEIDGDRERRPLWRVIGRHHRIEPQAAGDFLGHRRADNAAGVADDEGHLFRRAMGRGDKQIAFVFAVVVVGDDNDLAALKGADGLRDAFDFLAHIVPGSRLPGGSSGLSSMAQIVIGQDNRQHRFANRNDADADARVVPAFCRDFRLLTVAGDGSDRL